MDDREVKIRSGSELESAHVCIFLRWLKEGGRSSATAAKYAKEAQAMLAYLHGEAPSPALLCAYRAQLVARHRPQTVNVKLAAVNAYLRFIGLGELRQRFLAVQRRAFVEETRELTQEEYKRLADSARDKGRERLGLVIQTICATGIRVGELHAITVESAKAGRAEIAHKGKVRVILLPGRLRRALGDYAKRQGIRAGCIFRTRSGRPLDRSNIWRDMKRLAGAARVAASKVFPHNLRHLFARAYYKVEKNLAHLADILGHSSVETTRIYVAASFREHERTLERMHLLI